MLGDIREGGVMTITIDPFWAGVVSVLLAEFVIILVYGLWQAAKKKNK